MTPITPCLWFDNEAEEAAKFYTSIFKDSKIGKITRYGEAGQDIHGREPGAVMTVAFELNGQPYTALNGGPMFQFSEAISFQINCDTQEEIDHYWNELSEGGDKNAQQCGWLKDKFGVSWQVIPAALDKWMNGDSKSSEAVMNALLKMKKLDIATLERAYQTSSAR